jgi:hypothetical protein
MKRPITDDQFFCLFGMQIIDQQMTVRPSQVDLIGWFLIDTISGNARAFVTVCLYFLRRLVCRNWLLLRFQLQGAYGSLDSWPTCQTLREHKRRLLTGAQRAVFGEPRARLDTIPHPCREAARCGPMGR